VDPCAGTIGRALEESISLKKTEDRLSTNLNSEGLAGILLDEVAHLGSRRAQKDALLILDTSDIRKVNARKMEYLARDRDGSADELWTVTVCARCLPVRLVVTTSSRFISHCTQRQRPTQKRERRVAQGGRHGGRVCRTRGYWVADRGMDRKNVYTPLIEQKLRHITRLRVTANEHVPCLVEISGGSHATSVNFLSFVNLGL
jgi:hypothetical protein